MSQPYFLGLIVERSHSFWDDIRSLAMCRKLSLKKSFFAFLADPNLGCKLATRKPCATLKQTNQISCTLQQGHLTGLIGVILRCLWGTDSGRYMQRPHLQTIFMAVATVARYCQRRSKRLRTAASKCIPTRTSCRHQKRGICKSRQLQSSWDVDTREQRGTGQRFQT